MTGIELDNKVQESYLGASFEGPEGTTFEDDSVSLTQNEGHHANHHHQQKERG